MLQKVHKATLLTIKMELYSITKQFEFIYDCSIRVSCVHTKLLLGWNYKN